MWQALKRAARRWSKAAEKEFSLKEKYLIDGAAGARIITSHGTSRTHKTKRTHTMKPTPLYRRLASLLQAARNCDAANNTEWATRHRNTIRALVRQHMPRGSGFDNGTTLDEGASTPDKLVFLTAFHHMNDGGYYDGWTEHKVTITPSLAFGYDLRVSGRDRNGIKDYIAETFGHALDTEV